MSIGQAVKGLDGVRRVATINRKSPTFIGPSSSNDLFSHIIFSSSLRDLGNNGLERLGVIDGKVGQHFAVDFDTGLTQPTHQSGVRQPLEACRKLRFLFRRSRKA